MTDDLSAPLGQGIGRKREKNTKRNKWMAAIAFLGPRVLAGALGGVTLVFLGWVLFADAPLGGEPLVVVPADLHADAAGPGIKTVEANPGPAAEADRERPNRYDGPPIGAGQPAVRRCRQGRPPHRSAGSVSTRQLQESTQIAIPASSGQ